jgi:dienelactone hydrolase
VLIIGGSQGGLASTLAADLLAAHGHPALAIAYFNGPGLPSALVDIPLEYFAGALRWLRRQPQVEPQHVLTLGISFGSEAALLLHEGLHPDAHKPLAGVPLPATRSQRRTQPLRA